MRRRAEIFQLLASKDIDRHKMDLGVPVLSSLRSRHFDDLAGATLDHNEAVLPQSRALHGISGRSARIGALKGMLMLWWLCVSEDQRRSHCAKVRSADDGGAVGGGNNWKIHTCASSAMVQSVYKLENKTRVREM